MCICNRKKIKKIYLCNDCGSIFNKIIDLEYHYKYYHFENLDEQSYLLK
jgi:hypothetical protein